MKKIVWVLALILALSGCTGGAAQTEAGNGAKENTDKSGSRMEETTVPGDAAQKDSGVSMAKEDIIRQQEWIDYTLPENQEKLRRQDNEAWLVNQKKYQDFCRDYWAFANTVFSQIAGEGNVIYSPLSAYLPLSELSYALEDGSEPKADLIRLLRANAPEEYWTDKLMQHFQRRGYLTASSIWISKEDQPDLEFLQKNLTSDIYRIDFADKDAPQLQMDWINRWTKGFLKDQVKPEDFKDKNKDQNGEISAGREELFCRLIGTTYVKAAWREPFFHEKEDIFYGANGQEQKVPFLLSNPVNMMCYFTDRYQAVRVPLENGDMLVLLPREGESVEQLLQAGVLQEIAVQPEWTKKRVTLHMPDFTQSSRIELLPVLEKLGYTEISQRHTGYVNLAGKNPDGSEKVCRISQVLQESKIEVKKTGIEAASFTTVDVNKTVAIEEEPENVEVYVNRPYLYVITESGGLPSFLGVNRDFVK